MLTWIFRILAKHANKMWNILPRTVLIFNIVKEESTKRMIHLFWFISFWFLFKRLKKHFGFSHESLESLSIKHAKMWNISSRITQNNSHNISENRPKRCFTVIQFISFSFLFHGSIEFLPNVFRERDGESPEKCLQRESDLKWF